MDILSSYTSGSAITDLRNANKAEAETSFNEMIDQINTQTADTDTLMGSVQKAGASITAVGAIGKGVISNFAKLKAKISGKNSQKEGGDEEAEDEGGTEMDSYQTAPTRPTQTQQAGDSTETTTETTTEAGDEGEGIFDEGNEADNMGNVNFGDEGLDPIAESVGDTDAPLFGEDTDLPGAGGEVTGEDYTAEEAAEDLGEEGGTDFSQTVSTAQTAGGVLDPTGAEVTQPVEEGFEAAGEEGLELGADATTDAAASGLDTIGSTLGSIINSSTQAIGNAASTVGNAVSGAVDATSAAVEGAVDATTGAVEGGADVIAAAAGSAALEGAGAALDATGIGAPIGLILNIVGGLILGGTMAAGIVGEQNASNNQTEQTTDAQNQLKQATTGGLGNIAGKYAV